MDGVKSVIRVKVLLEYVDQDGQRKEGTAIDWERDNSHDLSVSFSTSRPVNMVRDATGAVVEVERSDTMTFTLKAERTEK